MVTKTTALIIASVVIVAAVASGVAIYKHMADTTDNVVVVVDDGSKKVPEIKDAIDFSEYKVLTTLVSDLDKYGGKLTSRDNKAAVEISGAGVDVSLCGDVIVIVDNVLKTTWFFDIHDLYSVVIYSP